jgi:hypothetical protein
MPEFPIENGGHETWPPSSPPTTCGDAERENSLYAQHASDIVRSINFSFF